MVYRQSRISVPTVVFMSKPTVGPVAEKYPKKATKKVPQPRLSIRKTTPTLKML
jgi:hypothetical protein